MSSREVSLRSNNLNEGMELLRRALNLIDAEHSKLLAENDRLQRLNESLNEQLRLARDLLDKGNGNMSDFGDTVISVLAQLEEKKVQIEQRILVLKARLSEKRISGNTSKVILVRRKQKSTVAKSGTALPVLKRGRKHKTKPVRRKRRVSERIRHRDAKKNEKSDEGELQSNQVYPAVDENAIELVDDSQLEDEQGDSELISKMNEIKKQIAENGENVLNVSVDEKSARKKKDACYFCGKTFVKIETHLLHHTNETEIMDINKLRPDSEEERAIFSELIRKGNANHTEKQNARLSAILNVSETDIVPLGRPTRSNTNPANYMLCPNCQNVYFKSQIVTHYAACLQSGYNLCGAVDDDTKEKTEKNTNSDKEKTAKKDNETRPNGEEKEVQETVSASCCAQENTANMVEETSDYSAPKKVEDLVETEKRNPEEAADSSVAEEKSVPTDNSANIRIDKILCKLEDDAMRSIIRNDPTILRFVDIELAKQEDDMPLNDLIRQIWCLARYLNIFKDVVQNEELKLIDTFHVTDEKTVSKVINICCSKFEDRKDLHVLKSAFEKIIESLKVKNKESPTETKADVPHSSSSSLPPPPPPPAPYSTELKTEDDNFTLQAEEDSLGEIPNSNFGKTSFAETYNSMDMDEMNIKEWAEDEMDPLMVEDENPLEEEEGVNGESLEGIQPSASVEHANVPSNKYDETNTKKETSLNLPVTSELDSFNMYVNSKLSFWTQAEIGSCEEYRQLCKYALAKLAAFNYPRHEIISKIKLRHFYHRKHYVDVQTLQKINLEFPDTVIGKYMEIIAMRDEHSKNVAIMLPPDCILAIEKLLSSRVSFESEYVFADCDNPTTQLLSSDSIRNVIEESNAKTLKNLLAGTLVMKKYLALQVQWRNVSENVREAVFLSLEDHLIQKLGDHGKQAFKTLYEKYYRGKEECSTRADETLAHSVVPSEIDNNEKLIGQVVQEVLSQLDNGSEVNKLKKTTRDENTSMIRKRCHSVRCRWTAEMQNVMRRAFKNELMDPSLVISGQKLKETQKRLRKVCGFDLKLTTLRTWIYNARRKAS